MEALEGRGNPAAQSAAPSRPRVTKGTIMTTLVVPLKTKTQALLEKYTKRTHSRPVKIAQDAIDRYLAILEFDEMRKLVEPHARKRGFRTDEDVFKAMR